LNPSLPHFAVKTAEQAAICGRKESWQPTPTKQLYTLSLPESRQAANGAACLNITLLFWFCGTRSHPIRSRSTDLRWLKQIQPYRPVMESSGNG